MDMFTLLFGGLLTFFYHCFNRIVIYGYLHVSPITSGNAMGFHSAMAFYRRAKVS